MVLLEVLTEKRCRPSRQLLLVGIFKHYWGYGRVMGKGFGGSWKVMEFCKQEWELPKRHPSQHCYTNLLHPDEQFIS